MPKYYEKPPSVTGFKITDVFETFRDIAGDKNYLVSLEEYKEVVIINTKTIKNLFAEPQKGDYILQDGFEFCFAKKEHFENKYKDTP